MNIPEHAVPGWHHDAACAGHPEPELWFPMPAVQDVSEPKGICGRCDARDACAEYAIKTKTSDGIFAGYRLPEQHADLKAAYRHVSDKKQRAPQAVRKATCKCGIEFNGARNAVCWGCRKGWVRVTQVREHVLECTAAGATQKAVARATNGVVGEGVISNIVAGSTHHMDPRKAAAILALDPRQFATAVSA